MSLVLLLRSGAASQTFTYAGAIDTTCTIIGAWARTVVPPTGTAATSAIAGTVARSVVAGGPGVAQSGVSALLSRAVAPPAAVTAASTVSGGAARTVVPGGAIGGQAEVIGALARTMAPVTALSSASGVDGAAVFVLAQVAAPAQSPDVFVVFRRIPGRKRVRRATPRRYVYQALAVKRSWYPDAAPEYVPSATHQQAAREDEAMVLFDLLEEAA